MAEAETLPTDKPCGRITPHHHHGACPGVGAVQSVDRINLPEMPLPPELLAEADGDEIEAELYPSANATPCGRLMPHYSHQWYIDAHRVGRCPGVRPTLRRDLPNEDDDTKRRRIAAGADVEDSPLPCRCYFVNGRRITADCTSDHSKVLEPGDSGALLDRMIEALHAPGDQRRRAQHTVAKLFGYFVVEGTKSPHAAQFLREIVEETEGSHGG